MKDGKILVTYRQLYIFIFLAIFVKPAFFEQIAILDALINVLRVTVGGFVIGIYFLKNQMRMSKFIFIMCLFQGSILLSTIVNHASLYRWFQYAVSCLPIIFMVELNRDYPKDILSSAMLLYELLIYANFITMVVFKNGLYSVEGYSQCWILGMKNNFSYHFMPAMAVALLHRRYSGNKIRGNILILTMLLSSLLGRSSTLLIGIFLTIALILLSRTKLVKILNYRNLTILYVIISAGMVIGGWQKYFSFIIVDVLEKDLTLTYRTFMWDRGLKVFLSHPILGVGKETLEKWTMRIGLEHTQLHNQLLDYAYVGGSVLLVIVFWANHIIGKTLTKFKENYFAISLNVVIFGMHVMMISEAYYAAGVYFLFALGGIADSIIKNAPDIECKVKRWRIN